MVNCIVLDGWHKGHMIRLPNTPQEIHLLRPRTITIDDCCDGEKVADIPKGQDTYILAMGSIDGDTALYSSDGSSKSMWENKRWVVPNDKNWIEEDLYVGIHDHRASVDSSSLIRNGDKDVQ